MWGPAAYHIQQSAEKFLKAAITSRGNIPPKTHDLVHLVSLVSATCDKEVEEAANLTTVYAWLTRYPGAPPIGEHHIDDAVGRLKVIKSWALSMIEEK